MWYINCCWIFLFFHYCCVCLYRLRADSLLVAKELESMLSKADGQLPLEIEDIDDKPAEQVKYLDNYALKILYYKCLSSHQCLINMQLAFLSDRSLSSI